MKLRYGFFGGERERESKHFLIFNKNIKVTKKRSTSKMVFPKNGVSFRANSFDLIFETKKQDKCFIVN